MAQHSTAPPRSAVAVALGTVFACVISLAVLPAQAASNVSDVVQGVAALAAGIGAGWHVRRCTDRRTRAAWILIASACSAWAAGEAYWCWHTLRADVVPFPSLADVGFLSFAALMAVGLLVHPARGGRIAFLQRLFDGLLAAGAVGLVSWLTTLSAVAGADAGATGLERLLLLAYPSSDVLLVVFTVLLLTRAGGNRTALHLVGAGVLALGVSDSSFAYLGALGVYDGGLIDLGWIGGFLLIALAGVTREPAAQTARASGRLTDGADEVTVPTSVLPYVPVLVALAVVAAVTFGGRPLTRAEMLVACGIVLCLLARQYLAVRDNVQLVRELAAREQQLRRQAFTDSLTGLANRSLFRDRLEHVLELHTRDCRPVAVVFLDLDDFKAVNDGYGHAAGDELLGRVAERITGATRAGDTVSRLGGDEFAVLLEDAADPLQTAARIRDALQPVFVLAGAEHTVRASVGVAAVTADDPPVTADTLLARSDAAMYGAKRAGKATIARFEAATGEVVHAGRLLPAQS
jgi:diguanylate cyclase